MPSWGETYKPRASRRVHLALAAIMWTVVGGTLFAVGASWVVRGPSGMAPWAVALVLAMALTTGWAKSRYILDHAARRIADRIETRGDGRCIGGFLSFRSWGLVLFMAALGRLLRSGLMARSIVGLVYVAVGTALVLSSMVLYRAWRARSNLQAS